MKAQGANIVDKPTPMQQGDIMRCAENARAGGITPIYGLIVAALKSLCGCRNPVFAAWTWDQIEFIPTAVYNKETNDVEVRCFRDGVAKALLLAMHCCTEMHWHSVVCAPGMHAGV